MNTTKWAEPDLGDRIAHMPWLLSRREQKKFGPFIRKPVAKDNN